MYLVLIVISFQNPFSGKVINTFTYIHSFIIIVIIIVIIIIIIIIIISLIKVLFSRMFSASSVKKSTDQTIFLISKVYLAS